MIARLTEHIGLTGDRPQKQEGPVAFAIFGPCVLDCQAAHACESPASTGGLDLGGEPTDLLRPALLPCIRSLDEEDHQSGDHSAESGHYANCELVEVHSQILLGEVAS